MKDIFKLRAGDTINIRKTLPVIHATFKLQFGKENLKKENFRLERDSIPVQCFTNCSQQGAGYLDFCHRGGGGGGFESQRNKKLCFARQASPRRGASRAKKSFLE